MIKKLLALSITLVISTASSYVSAEGNVSSGKSKAANCASCHGEDGNSMMPGFPKLAGQHAGYLEKQLLAFKNNNRNGPMMAPMAMGLDESDIEDISAYYSSQSISSNPPPVIDNDDEDDDAENTDDLDTLLAVGKDLYLNGNLKTEVPACIACHGPKGEGNKPSSFPSIRHQHADYMIKTLTDFKNAKRSNQSDNMMRMIAKKMSDKEIKALSYYISLMK